METDVQHLVKETLLEVVHMYEEACELKEKESEQIMMSKIGFARCLSLADVLLRYILQI